MDSETLEKKKLDEGTNLEEKELVQAEEEVNDGEEIKDEEVESEQEEKKTQEEEEEEESPNETSQKEEEEEGTLTKVSEIVGKRKRKGKGTPSSTEPATTPIQRPSRERKIVQRYSTPSSEKSSSSKTVNIQQGRGTPLKEIPNVAFKLSKRKADENLQMLHTILFGKRTKTYNLKRNIHQFSGFVWVENEDKQRAKIREKLDKCVKEKLVDFCDMLDIPVLKATTKKDEVVGKLLEFLESPHATRDVSLADKEQSQKDKKLKRKTLASTGTASKDASSKKQKQTGETRKKQNSSTVRMDKGEDEDEEAESAEAKLQSDEDDVTMHIEESDEEDEELSEKEDKAKEVKEGKNFSAKKSLMQTLETKIKPDKRSPKKSEKIPKSAICPTKSVRSPERPKKSPLNSKKGATTDDKVSNPHSKSKVSTSKKPKSDKKDSQKNQGAFSYGKKSSKKQQSKLGLKLSCKVEGSTKLAVKEPSRAEMHAAVGDLLKKVDFNTATLSDILRQLEKQFDMSLMHRKSDVRNIIEEVINSMTDEEDGGEEADDNGSEHDLDKDNDD